MKDKKLDKATIDTYQSWVQYGIRRDLNSVGLGPGRLPYRSALFMLICAFGCLFVGLLLIGLRMRHVYLWDWGSQFLGPFFFILFLLCTAAALYLIVVAKRRSNMYRSQLYFRPIGDWGVSCVHKSELALEEEFKHDLKSGTTPHKTVKPRSEAYSQSGKENRSKRPHDGRRGPPPDGRRGPPPEGRRGPPPDGRRGPPPEGRRGPPPDGRRGPPPREKRDLNDNDGSNRPPPDQDFNLEDRPPSDDRRRAPHNGHRAPSQPGRPKRVSSDDEGGHRPRGVPRFEGVERIPDERRQEVKYMFESSQDESDL
uniref:Uncharacterized protein n=1 Tax=Arion vulgaris TaxID=1028688 RepID=A0A0B6ZYR3_9EUPU